MKKDWNLRDNWGDDFVDSCDIISRYEELEAEYEELQSEYKEAETEEEKSECLEKLEEWEDEWEDELKGLEYINSVGSDSSEWSYGLTLIHERYFNEYAEDLAYDICDVPSNQWNQWPFNCINWNEAAEQLKADYYSIEWNDEEYWALY